MADFEVRADHGTVTFKPAGRIDTAAARDFERRAGVALKGTQAMVMDLSDVTYMSSLGLRVVLFAAKTVKANGGKFAVAAPPDHILDVFRLAGFTTILRIFDTVELAAADVLSDNGQEFPP